MTSRVGPTFVFRYNFSQLDDDQPGCFIALSHSVRNCTSPLIELFVVWAFEHFVETVTHRMARPNGAPINPRRDKLHTRLNFGRWLSFS